MYFYSIECIDMSYYVPNSCHKDIDLVTVIKERLREMLEIQGKVLMNQINENLCCKIFIGNT